MRRQFEQKLGPIDILVANAGGSFTQPGPFASVINFRSVSLSLHRPLKT
jgi:NADP-dependent 3-hydroxy acid dehydrogenase YdfG